MASVLLGPLRFRAEAEMPVRRFVARIQERSDGSLAKCTAKMLRRVVRRACGTADRLNEWCERGGGTGDSAVCRTLCV